MTALQYIGLQCRGNACILTLQREDKLNALSAQVESDLHEALQTPEVRDSRCLIFTGSGRAFSAGADIGEMGRNDPAGIMAYYWSTGNVNEEVAALPQPTISAIHGYCLGGGVELALATDFRIADETAVFGLPEVGIGIIPSSGGMHRLVRMIGPARAREWILLAGNHTAAEAREAGIVTEVVPAGQALDRALALADHLATMPPLALTVAKSGIDSVAASDREAALAIERLAYGMLAQTEDASEAARAFVEKRAPHFQGR